MRSYSRYHWECRGVEGYWTLHWHGKGALSTTTIALRRFLALGTRRRWWHRRTLSRLVFVNGGVHMIARRVHTQPIHEAVGIGLQRLLSFQGQLALHTLLQANWSDCLDHDVDYSLAFLIQNPRLVVAFQGSHQVVQHLANAGVCIQDSRVEPNCRRQTLLQYVLVLRFFVKRLAKPCDPLSFRDVAVIARIKVGRL
jgi:hypothetical protein